MGVLRYVSNVGLGFRPEKFVGAFLILLHTQLNLAPRLLSGGLIFINTSK